MKSPARLCRTPNEWIGWYWANHRMWKQKTWTWVSCLFFRNQYKGPETETSMLSCYISLQLNITILQGTLVFKIYRTRSDALGLCCGPYGVLRVCAETLTPKVTVLEHRMKGRWLGQGRVPTNVMGTIIKKNPKSWVLLLYRVKKKTSKEPKSIPDQFISGSLILDLPELQEIKFLLLIIPSLWYFVKVVPNDYCSNVFTL